MHDDLVQHARAGLFILQMLHLQADFLPDVNGLFVSEAVWHESLRLMALPHYTQRAATASFQNLFQQREHHRALVPTDNSVARNRRSTRRSPYRRMASPNRIDLRQPARPNPADETAGPKASSVPRRLRPLRRRRRR